MEIFDLDMTHFVQYRPASMFQAEQLVITEVPRNREWFAAQLPVFYTFWVELDRKKRIMDEIKLRGLFDSVPMDTPTKKRLRQEIEVRHEETKGLSVPVMDESKAVFDMPVDPPEPPPKRRKKAKFDFCRLVLEEVADDVAATPVAADAVVTTSEPMEVTEEAGSVPDDPWGAPPAAQ